MKVEIGNADALDVVVSDQGEMAFVNVEGERVTTFDIPDDHTAMEAFQIVLAGLPRLINPTARPWWVECDNEMVESLLCDHFGIPRATHRPPQWGDGSTTAPREIKQRDADAKKAAALARKTPKETA